MSELCVCRQGRVQTGEITNNVRHYPQWLDDGVCLHCSLPQYQPHSHHSHSIVPTSHLSLLAFLHITPTNIHQTRTCCLEPGYQEVGAVHWAHAWPCLNYK